MTYSTIQFMYDSPRCNSHYLMSLKLKQYRKKIFMMKLKFTIHYTCHFINNFTFP